MTGPRRPARILKVMLISLAVLAGALILALSIGAWLVAAPRYRGARTPHFDGDRFHNQAEVTHQGFGDFLRWQRTRQRGAWRSFTAAEPGPPPPRRVGRGALRVTFINHATVLIQMDGLNILTDPIWSERCSPVSWAGPRRVRPPGIRFADLPPIDLVLISHNHYDHLDVPTLQRLLREHHPRIVVGLGNAALLAKRGVTQPASAAGALTTEVATGLATELATELDWWQGVEVAPEVRVTVVPAQHFSGRGISDRDRNLWAGFVVQGPAGAVYFAGDTGMGPHFREIADRFGPIRLAILPIGAFRPEWFMARVHVSPEESLQAHRLLGARTSVAMHFGTFPLADDAEDEAPDRLRALVEGQPDRFWVLGFGEGRDVP